MAVEMFVRLDGITGGSRNYYHKGWADVLSWSWGLERVHGATGNMRMNELSLIKAIGVESPAMMTAFAEGKPIKQVDLSIVPVVGKRDAQQKYVAITLEDVLIKSITTGGSAEESFFRENLTLCFGKIKYEYHQYADVGSDGGAGTPKSFAFGWDVAANAAI
ncbi:MAG: type VI secretion system tube protein Hcp [Gammaproteobacteria bacterium]|nr:type VI secretion system tube protein Hcp [Gammaproteobacteria bacterium]